MRQAGERERAPARVLQRGRGRDKAESKETRMAGAEERDNGGCDDGGDNDSGFTGFGPRMARYDATGNTSAAAACGKCGDDEG